MKKKSEATNPFLIKTKQGSKLASYQAVEGLWISNKYVSNKDLNQIFGFEGLK